MREDDPRAPLGDSREGALGVVVAGVAVVDPDHVEGVPVELDGAVLVREDVHLPEVERGRHALGVEPVVVVPERREDRCVEGAEDPGQVGERLARVAHVVAREQDQVGLHLVQHRDRAADPPRGPLSLDVEVGQVRDRDAIVRGVDPGR